MAPEELTPEQRDLWDAMGMDRGPIPSEGQSKEQAVEFAVASFRYACSFRGIPKPPDEVIKSGLLAE